MVSYFKLFCLQVWDGEEYLNFEICRTMAKAFQLAVEELPGQKYRVLGLTSEGWIEVVISGSLLHVSKDFRMLSLVGF
ncbi:hypothetical protein [Candidatus Desulfosporosinus nitrosoreducens]|uniref:hypothetical protein n=1 Tax=Candidatus Desulfosporosinus nitrosoreducens TaxID=3401928 RepID=UPI00280BFAD2|nr:hypothetical protein [Desulfosporosinus sp. PR]